MVALIPVACQTAPDLSTSLLLPLQPSTTLVIVVLHLLWPAPLPHSSPHLPPHASSFAYISRQFASHSASLAHSLSLSVCQSVSQSFSQLFLVVCLHYLLAPFTHIWFATPSTWLDSIFFEYNSQPAKEEWESEKNWRWWILALTQKTSALSLRRKTCLPDWLWSAF